MSLLMFTLAKRTIHLYITLYIHKDSQQYRQPKMEFKHNDSALPKIQPAQQRQVKPTETAVLPDDEAPSTFHIASQPDQSTQVAHKQKVLSSSAKKDLKENLRLSLKPKELRQQEVEEIRSSMKRIKNSKLHESSTRTKKRITEDTIYRFTTPSKLNKEARNYMLSLQILDKANQCSGELAKTQLPQLFHQSGKVLIELKIRKIIDVKAQSSQESKSEEDSVTGETEVKLQEPFWQENKSEVEPQNNRVRTIDRPQLILKKQTSSESESSSKRKSSKNEESRDEDSSKQQSNSHSIQNPQKFSVGDNQFGRKGFQEDSLLDGDDLEADKSESLKQLAFRARNGQKDDEVSQKYEKERIEGPESLDLKAASDVEGQILKNKPVDQQLEDQSLQIVQKETNSCQPLHSLLQEQPTATISIHESQFVPSKPNACPLPRFPLQPPVAVSNHQSRNQLFASYNQVPLSSFNFNANFGAGSVNNPNKFEFQHHQNMAPPTLVIPFTSAYEPVVETSQSIAEAEDNNARNIIVIDGSESLRQISKIKEKEIVTINQDISRSNSLSESETMSSVPKDKVQDSDQSNRGHIGQIEFSMRKISINEGQAQLEPKLAQQEEIVSSYSNSASQSTHQIREGNLRETQESLLNRQKQPQGQDSQGQSQYIGTTSTFRRQRLKFNKQMHESPQYKRPRKLHDYQQSEQSYIESKRQEIAKRLSFIKSTLPEFLKAYEKQDLESMKRSEAHFRKCNAMKFQDPRFNQIASLCQNLSVICQENEVLPPNPSIVSHITGATDLFRFKTSQGAHADPAALFLKKGSEEASISLFEAKSTKKAQAEEVPLQKKKQKGQIRIYE